MKKKELIKQMQQKGKKELQEVQEDLEKQLAKLRLELGFGKLKDISQIGVIRKDLARVKTILESK